MDLSVIIVNYRGWGRLKDCLDELLSHTGSGFTSEVIIADNNSSDGKLGAFTENYPGFRFISNPLNGGFAYGCNRGAEAASSKYLLFLNPDTIAGEDALKYLLDRAVEASGNFIISCRQVNEKGRESKAYGVFPSPGRFTGTGRFITGLFSAGPAGRKFQEEPDIMRPDWVSGSVILIKRDFFRQLNGFDEEFWMYYEDVDLCRRAKNAGAEILFYRKPSISHLHGGSSRLDLKTTALTKSEVLISQHVYISKHFRGSVRLFSQFNIAAGNILSGLAGTIAGVILFFIPRMRAQIMIFFRILGYYLKAARCGSWVSSRAVNNPCKIKNNNM